MTVNSDRRKEEEMCLFFLKRQITLRRIVMSWLNKQLESASKQRVVQTECIRHLEYRWELVCDLKTKKRHPLCISSYLKITRIHFCGIQYVMSYDLYVLYCSYSSL